MTELKTILKGALYMIGAIDEAHKKNSRSVHKRINMHQA